jgi:hypothetical protein
MPQYTIHVHDVRIKLIIVASEKCSDGECFHLAISKVPLSNFRRDTKYPEIFRPYRQIFLHHFQFIIHYNSVIRPYII